MQANKRRYASEKTKKRIIVILTVLLAALTAVGLTALKAANEKKPSVTVTKTERETIERSYSSDALVISDEILTKAVFIDNDYDIHYITKNIRAEIKTASGTTLTGTVTNINEEKPGSAVFKAVTSALTDSQPDIPVYIVTVTFDDPESILKNSDKVTARVITKTAEKAITVPQSAVFREDDRTYVWVFRPIAKRLIQKDVTTGLYSDSNVEITEGLSKGEWVVSGASCTSDELRNGIKVKLKAKSNNSQLSP